MIFANILSKRINEYKNSQHQIPRLKMYYSTYRKLRSKYPNWFKDSTYKINIESYRLCTQPEHATIRITYLNDYEIEMIDDRLRDLDLEESDIGVVLI